MFTESNETKYLTADVSGNFKATIVSIKSNQIDKKIVMSLKLISELPECNEKFVTKMFNYKTNEGKEVVKMEMKRLGIDICDLQELENSQLHFTIKDELEGKEILIRTHQEESSPFRKVFIERFADDEKEVNESLPQIASKMKYNTNDIEKVLIAMEHMNKHLDIVNEKLNALTDRIIQISMTVKNVDLNIRSN